MSNNNNANNCNLKKDKNMSNEFLPTGYKVPSNSNYFTLRQGENNFRVLSSAIIGYEYWTNEIKPIRLKERPRLIPKDIKIEKDGKPSPIKHFWAFLIWNYEEEKVQVMEISQFTIQNDILALVDNKKWGDPKGYDITITKTGEGKLTKYNTMPNPHTPITAGMKKEIEANPVNLDNLFKGEDPFSSQQVGLEELNIAIEQAIPQMYDDPIAQMQADMGE